MKTTGLVDSRTGRPTVARLCPSCVRRFARIVRDDCPICAGTGMLVLGSTPVELHGQSVVSLAIGIALEAQARHDLAQPDMDLGAARINQSTMVQRIRDIGLLAPLPGEAGRTTKLKVRSGRSGPRRRPQAKAPRGGEWVVDDWLPSPIIDGFTCGAFITHSVPEREWACRDDPQQLLLW
ncbi:hypothetical protein SAMN04515671_1090 [Nakamurella panacisegetis]|uniref:Uncharacterized protein n=1 Tax=Nakamurella panacisegetis TaxID=1090615 RepID=A0A1H0JYD3_9ACTN|nr:hypothetical protein [Nakamurella panacisegetis]SDO48532.1 hypothetical protein SAMN04515671_1090 [Nakamurella panacisegetis]